MGLKLISPPAVKAVTLTEAKKHLRVTHTDDDIIINALIDAAIGKVEGWTGRALVDQTWDLVLDEFPGSNSSCFVQTRCFNSQSALAIQIPKPPLIGITQIAYDDANGDEQIMDPADYFVDDASEPGWVVPAGITSWPATIVAINSVRVRFRAGYLFPDSPPTNAVPEDIKAAVKLILADLYEYRESQVAGTISSALPYGVENILRRHRVLLGMS